MCGDNCEVTVVIPAYKASDTIARSLTSVFAQTRLPAEVIVIDDASPDADDLRIAIKALTVPDGVKLRHLQNETNLNGAATRNRGILAATTPIIAFLDADDEWEPEKLQVCLDSLERAAQGAPAIVYSQVRVVAENQTLELRPRRGIRASEHISEYLFLSGGFVQTSTIVCPTPLAAKVQFDSAFRRHQDYDFCLRMSAEGAGLIYVNRPLVRYHAAPGTFGQRREDPDYTRSWGDAMRHWMSRRGYHGFRLFLVTGRLIGQRHYGAAMWNALLHGILLGPLGVWQARHKLAAIAKRSLSR